MSKIISKANANHVSSGDGVQYSRTCLSRHKGK